MNPLRVLTGYTCVSNSSGPKNLPLRVRSDNALSGFQNPPLQNGNTLPSANSSRPKWYVSSSVGKTTWRYKALAIPCSFSQITTPSKSINPSKKPLNSSTYSPNQSAKMQFKFALVTIFAALALAAPAPNDAPAPELEKRCTANGGKQSTPSSCVRGLD